MIWFLLCTTGTQLAHGAMKWPELNISGRQAPLETDSIEEPTTTENRVRDKAEVFVGRQVGPHWTVLDSVTRKAHRWISLSPAILRSGNLCSNLPGTFCAGDKMAAEFRTILPIIMTIFS